MSKAKLTQDQSIPSFNTSKSNFFQSYNATGLTITHARITEELNKIEASGRKYRQMMEMDVELLKEVLQRRDHDLTPEDHSANLAYLMDRAAALTRYYSKHHMDNHQKREKYRKMCVEIEDLQKLLRLDRADKAIKELFEEQKISIRNVTGQKKVAGKAHGTRITWTFFRLTLIATVSLTLSEAEKVKDVVNVPNELCRALSVGLMAFRLFANLGVMATEVRDWDSFKDQLEQHICQILNDLAWMIINLITNYNKLFTMPGFNMVQDVFVFGHALPIAGVVTSAFLVFDVGVLLLQWFAIDKRKFDMKRAQLEAEQNMDDIPEARKNIIALELKELDIAMITKRAQMIFSVVAGSLLVIGFTASMFFSAGMSLPISYAVVLLGCGFYDCAEAFGQWRGANERVKQATSKELDAAKSFRTQALKDFGISLMKNVALPGLIIGVCAASWQAALGIVVAYAAYWLFTTGKEMWKQHQKDKANKKLAEEKDVGIKPSPSNVSNAVPDTEKTSTGVSSVESESNVKPGIQQGTLFRKRSSSVLLSEDADRKARPGSEPGDKDKVPKEDDKGSKEPAFSGATVATAR